MPGATIDPDSASEVGCSNARVSNSDAVLVSDVSGAGVIKVWAAVAGSFGRVRITEVVKLYEAGMNQTDDDDHFETDEEEGEPSSLTFLWVLVRPGSAPLDP